MSSTITQFPTSRRITRQMRREMSDESLQQLQQYEDSLINEFVQVQSRKRTASSNPSAEYIASMSHPNMVLTFYNEYTLGNIAEDAYIDYIGRYVIPSVRSHLINVDKTIYNYDFRRYYKAIMFQRIAEFLNGNPMFHTCLSNDHCVAYCNMIAYYFDKEYTIANGITFGMLMEKYDASHCRR
jgi:hypothetical protein